MLSRQCLSAGAANSRAATHSCGRAPLVPIAPLGRATPSAAPSRPCVNADEVPQRAALQVVAAGKKGKSTAGKGFGAPKKVDAAVDPSLPCPCGSGQTYEDCCQRYHERQAVVTTPEQLLRSRYTAYALKNADYIADTTNVECQEYSGTRNTYLQTVRQTQRRLDFQELKIEKQEPGANANEAYILFRCYYVDKQATGNMVGKRIERFERSHFVKTKAGWTYMGSELMDDMPGEEGAGKDSSGPSLDFGLPKIQLPSLKF